MQQRDNGVRVAFNGIEDAENNTLLKLDEGNGLGLGIEILDGNMRPGIEVNDLHTGMQWIQWAQNRTIFCLTPLV